MEFLCRCGIKWKQSRRLPPTSSVSDKRSEKRKSDNVSTITEDADLDIQMPDTVIEFLKLLYDSRNVARADDRKPQVAAVEPEEGESRPSTPPAM